mmetsp:Transcript_120505/g.341497  ORF Transcript_120505/g.341497 Transcript_120505/m.341497 type:complete len:98 (-) Transcript_120505:145-438(-)
MQFFKQEYDEPRQIIRRSGELGFGGENAHVMATVRVRGEGASPVFDYLQAKTKKRIGWNFGVYFLVSRNGAIEGHKNVAPKKLTDRIRVLTEEYIAT